LPFQIDVFLERVLGTTDYSLTTCFASCHLPDCRRDSDANRLENLAACPEAFTPYGERLALVFYSDLLQGFEILLDVSPFETVTGFL
jgi:hypothetical protein